MTPAARCKTPDEPTRLVNNDTRTTDTHARPETLAAVT